MKKNFPVILLVAGGLLILGAAGYALFGSSLSAVSTPAPASGGAPASSGASAGSSSASNSSAPSGSGVPAAAGKDVPQTIANLPLSSSDSGAAALDGIQQLHQDPIAITGGASAIYGTGAIRLWVAETESEAAALQLVKAMETAIANGGTQFKPVGVFQFRGKDVYYLESDTSTDFYMQSGSKVIWVSTTSDVAEQAMKEMLDFYP